MTTDARPVTDARPSAPSMPPSTPPSTPATNRAPFSVWRAPDGTLHRDLPLQELARIYAAGEGQLWVDVDATQRSQHALLEKVFRFHPLTIEDTLNPQSRVKYEEHDAYLFVVARGVRFCDETSDPYDIETINLCSYLGPGWLVTVHGEGATAIDRVRERVEQGLDVLGRGPARLLHAVLDEAVDEFFPILDRVDGFLDGLEERVFVQFDQSALRDIFSVKRLVLQLRRHLAPQREVLNQLTNRPTELLPTSTQLYFRDVYDHVLRINDALDAYRELLSSTLDSYLSQVSNRQGQSSKALAVVATVTLPFVIVSGMWGMNFDRVPLAHHPHGFWLLLGTQLLIAAVILAALRWRRII
jgi:magnesium transporter